MSVKVNFVNRFNHACVMSLLRKVVGSIGGGVETRSKECANIFEGYYQSSSLLPMSDLFWILPCYFSYPINISGNIRICKTKLH